MERSASFEDLYRAERSRVLHAVAFTIGDRDLAAEVTDEAFARAFERWASMSATGNPVGWVYRVALNLARNRFRRRSLERRRPGPIATATVVTDDPTDVALAVALAALSIEHRSVVVLRYHLDWSVEEVAVALDVAPGTVKSRLHRALAKLAELLEDEA